MHRILSVLIWIKISLFEHFQYKDLFASDSFVNISKEGSINFAYLPNIGIIWNANRTRMLQLNI
jgi:hypothetical protein